MVTTVNAELVKFSFGRDLEAKLLDIVSVVDYGASTTNSAGANTALINSALAELGSGQVLIPYGIAYTESSLIIPSDIVLYVVDGNGVVGILTANTGSSPAATGGISIKQKGMAGVLLRAVDFGVASEPLLQIVAAGTGYIAGANARFLELDEVSGLASPAIDKVRLEANDSSGVTTLRAKFPDGSVVRLAAAGMSSNLSGTLTYDPASIASGASVTTTLTVTGASIGDPVLVGFTKQVPGVIVSGFVATADTVSVVFVNVSGSLVNLDSGLITAIVVKTY